MSDRDPLLVHVLAATGAPSATRGERIQSLWSGYGEIVRYHINGESGESSVVAKHVSPPDGGRHPRGWNTDRSHLRKLRSYEVEMAWYRDWSSHCGPGCRVPSVLSASPLPDDAGWVFVLEDLDAAGYPERLGRLNENGIEDCLTWLAEFHATFLGDKPDGLWAVGTYWHLATRPDELQAVNNPALREAASAIDERLNSARFQSIVHGDAKIANFCFARNGRGVAAVDFQYVGGGCGMKDVAYFLGSCLPEEQCERDEQKLLGFYFDALHEAIGRLGKPQNPLEVEAEWRDLYPIAWTDFHRFLVGWSPGHWKLTDYSERLATQVIKSL